MNGVDFYLPLLCHDLVSSLAVVVGEAVLHFRTVLLSSLFWPFHPLPGILADLAVLFCSALRVLFFLQVSSSVTHFKNSFCDAGFVFRRCFHLLAVSISIALKLVVIASRFSSSMSSEHEQ